MNEFPQERAAKLLDRLVKRWCRDQTHVRDAMAELVEGCEPMQRRLPWGKLRAVEWGAGRGSFLRWLHDEFDAYPPPARVKGLWFNAPAMEFGNPLCWVVGGCGFASANGDLEWASRTIWPPEAVLQRPERMRRVPINVVLEPLLAAQKVLRIRETDPEDYEQLDTVSFPAYILPLGYVSALLADVMPLAWPRLVLSGTKRRGVACGFQSGDGVTLGWLTEEGWAR